MKKTLATLVVILMGLSMTASALPPVTYDPTAGCPLTMNFNGYQFSTWITLLRQADADELRAVLYSNPEAEDADLIPIPWQQVDLEGGVGDGVADFAQAVLLTSATCADPGILADFQVNAALAAGLITDLGALVDWADDADSLTAVGQAVIDAGTLLSNEDLIGLGTYVQMFADLLLPEINSDSSIADTVGGLGVVAEVIAAEASLSTEMNMTMSMLLTSLLEGLAEAPSELDETPLAGLTPAQICQYFAGQLTDTAALAEGMGQTALADACEAGAATFTAGAEAINKPVAFTVVGVTKLDNEPFSAAGDYDGVGMINAEVYAYVEAAGGDAADFVAGASGSSDFWTGNPELPAAGIIGLAALVSAIAAGGAFVLRKK